MPGLTLLSLLSVAAATAPPFRFSSVHGDGMVLQAAPQPSTVWGFCARGDVVTVTVGGGAAVPAVVGPWLNSTVWMATLPATPASFVPVDVVATRASDGRTAGLRDVLFGDVWVCSGRKPRVSSFFCFF